MTKGSAKAAMLAVVFTAGVGQASAAGVRAAYIERCAGCHGFDGRSVSSIVPDLKDRAGYFLCDPGSRDYMGRLPNVVFSAVTDAELADLLNYVVFQLGGRSAPAKGRAYTAGELARMRESPLSSTDLKAYRRTIVERLVARCGAPDALRTEYGGTTGAESAGR